MRKNWLLPFANLICLVHCVGMGLFSASAPLWLSKFHLEWLEYSLIFFNLVVGVKVFQTLPVPKYRIYILVGGLLVSFVSLLFDFHESYHLSVAFTAIYQIFTLIQYHKKKNHKDCTCEHHSHSPQKLTPIEKAKYKKISLKINQWKKEKPDPTECADKQWSEFEQELNKDRFNIPDRNNDEK